MTRREIREHLFIILFQNEFHEPYEMNEQLELYFDNIQGYFENIEQIQQEDKEYLKARFHMVTQYLGEIDIILAQATSGWKLNRMGKADLNIMRLAVFEIRFDKEMPDRVAINEAVELAKKYGGDSSASFINGVLAKVVV